MTIRAARTENVNYWASLWGAGGDMYAEAVAHFSGKERLWIGSLSTDLGAVYYGLERTHLLTVSPPQTGCKTSATIVTNVLLWHGPVVAVSTKKDVVRATAFHRSLMGRVWGFDPMNEGLPEGVERVYYSPIDGCKDWDRACQRAKRIIDIAGNNKVGGKQVSREEFWTVQAKTVLECLLHAAAHRPDLTMAELADGVAAADFSSSAASRLPTASQTFFEMISETLAGIGNRTAINEWNGFTKGYEKMRGSIISTLKVCLDIFYNTEVRRNVTETNFDTAAFVTGHPDHLTALGVKRGGLEMQILGQYDTLYINVPTILQEELRPLILSLLMDIRDEAYRLRTDADESIEPPKATLLGLDELYNLGAMPDLLSTLSEGASQGVFVCAAIQNLELAAERWGVNGAAAMMGLFGQVLIHRGVLPGAQLETFAKLGGRYDRPHSSWSEASPTGVVDAMFYRRWRETQSSSREDVLTTQTLFEGPPGVDNVHEFASDGTWSTPHLFRYYKGPFLLVFMSGMIAALNRGHDFPTLPPVARHGDLTNIIEACGDQVADWWASVTHQRRSQLNNRTSERTLGAAPEGAR